MGGGNRKKFDKSRRRLPQSSSSARALFVEGGVLADWSPSFNSHSSRGGNFNGDDGQGKSGSSRSKNGKAKHSPNSGSGSGYGSSSRGDHLKNRGSAIGYVYPSFDSQDNSFPEKGEDLQSHRIVLRDSKGTSCFAYIDEGSDKNIKGTNYVYDYTAGFTLGEGSQSALEINNEGKETRACSGPSAKVEGEEGSHDSPSNEGADKHVQATDYVYAYAASFTLAEGSHRGLGFNDGAKETPARFRLCPKSAEKEGSAESSSSDEEDMMAEDGAHSDRCTKTEDDFLGSRSSPEENPGFLSIGGLKIYTYDISDVESDEEELLDEESSDSSETGDSSDSSDSDGASDSGSEIDDEIAADYFQGIGGSDKIVNIDQLVGKVPTVLDDDSDSNDSYNETLEKFGGIALQEASREYGTRRPQSGRKSRREDHKVKSGKPPRLSAMDDLMFVKDPRTVSGRKKYGSRKSEKSRKVPGEKKKHRKEMIAVKRRERMLRRGVDLQQINSKLQQMVLDGLDILSFQPMHTRGCSQVQRLAAIYRLRSASQGSGKKKFVTVTRTQQTCMPSSADRVRLEKLIGANAEDDDFTVYDMYLPKGGRNTAKKASRFTDSSLKNLQADLSKKRSRKTASYAAQPVSFVSSGIMQPDVVEVKTIESNEANEICRDNKGLSSSVEYGSFELHTTGFGSKMMAKMGYTEGSGLGKDGQGMAEPIEVFQRPKSLGLGADVPEDTKPEASGKLVKKGSRSTAPTRSSESKGRSGKMGSKESRQFAAFERYTTGFGSKMMAKMGFVEGTGLGKDSQGMASPLVAVRRQKCQGLGAKH